MRLLPDWRNILKHAWSIRLLILAGVLSGLEIALPLIREIYMVPAGWFLIASIAATIAACVARLVAQRDVSGGSHE